MWADFRAIFRKPTPTEMAARELVEAQLARLAAQSAVDYANAIAAYNEARAKRLREFLNQGEIV